MEIQYERISKAVANGYYTINRMHPDGWTQDEITDNVCEELSRIGIEVTDVPTNCMRWKNEGNE
jgi:hypothetical protein